jgi:hypothetical protein
MKRAVTVGLVLAAVAWAGCSSAPPEPPAPSGAPWRDVVRRHYDQVCRDGQDTTSFVTLTEVFDTIGLASTLAERLDRGAQEWVGSESELDFVVQYDARGMPTASGVWSSTLDEASTASAAAILAARIQPLGQLLTEAGFRTRLSFEAGPSLALAVPVRCVPHLTHAEGEPATGLPEGVRLVGYVGRDPGNNAARVDVSLDANGQVTDIELVRGTEVGLARAREVIALLTFDPALRNGVGIPSTMRLGLTFRPAGGR